MAKSERILRLPIIFIAALLSACEQGIDDYFSKFVGIKSGLYEISIINLLVDGQKYDGLTVSVGGYLGRNYWGKAPAIYFVPDHIDGEDAAVGISLSNVENGLNHDNICRYVGDYVRIFGRFEKSGRNIDVEKFVVIKEPETRMSSSECAKMIAD